MAFFDSLLDRLGHRIARVLEREVSGYQPFTPSDPVTLRRVLQPADILLVEGNQKIAAAIKYLTQSTWSHAALYVGDALGPPDDGGEARTLIESNIGEGCVAVPLSKYRTYNTRICRPVGLTVADRRKVVEFMVSSIGTAYDTRNIVDLARYLLPTPPVPIRWRRRMIALGSGEPTRAICSSLIAQAFQSVPYPILPRIERIEGQEHVESAYSRREILHIRHHSLFAPRDFDLSPYFAVVKPTLESGFDYRRLNFADAEPGEGALPVVGARARTAATSEEDNV
ncbi:MAG: lipo-like protein [Hyphomicrobiales bacterium]|nr:lipo-like protein [Hyphomicrobiales bacterium]